MTDKITTGTPDAGTNPHASTNAARTEDFARRMVSWNSETGTPGEATFAEKLRSLLLELPYFQENPDNVRLFESHGNPKTYNVAALVRGTGKRTMALAGHFDTVSTDNYHELKHLSCDVSALKDALIADLAGRPRTEQEERALEDLTGGEFLPGRGMLDMKSGLAAGITCLESFAADPEREGNLLLLATPDEERESRGMRALRDVLPSIAADLDIEIAAGINMDVTSDQGDGREGRAIYAGTIGKLLPFALVIGCSSHASYPFEGVSAQAIAAGILSRLEGNADLADRDDTDISPPPICLEARDLRDVYEVTTPERFWIAFNWLYHAMTARSLFERFRNEVETGASEAVARFAAQASTFGVMTGKSAGAVPPAPKVITFAELREIAARAGGEAFEKEYAEREASLAAIDNPLARSRQLVDWLTGVARLAGPSVVIGFAGLHYPASRLDAALADDRLLQTSIDEARRTFSNEPQRSTVWKPYFQGISDMSFLGQAAESDDTVSANTPVAQLVDTPPGNSLRFPVVNIGPWGREFHQRLERVHAPYAFEVLPELVSQIVNNFLGASHPAKN